MENNTTNSPYKEQKQDRQRRSQLQTVFLYLKENVATASMIEAATGIHQKNICRYKRMLEKSDRLWVVCKKKCKYTGYKACYLTTNPKRKPITKQLNFFGDEK